MLQVNQPFCFPADEILVQGCPCPKRWLGIDLPGKFLKVLFIGYAAYGVMYKLFILLQYPAVLANHPAVISVIFGIQDHGLPVTKTPSYRNTVAIQPLQV